MPRKKRLIIPNQFYHVMMRGVGGQNIFFDNEDRVRFCLLLQYASEICNFSIHAFCFMNNHVHLLLQPHNDKLSEGIHRLGFRFAQHINKKLDRQGHLFQGRFKSIRVQSGSYLCRLIRYIHQNPTRAKLVNHPSDYLWSSHLSYSCNNHYTWLQTNTILKLFGTDLSTSRTAYQNYVCSNDDNCRNELVEIRKSFEVGAYGNNNFIHDFNDELNPPIRTPKSNQESLSYVNTFKFDLLLEEIENQTNLTLCDLKSNKKSRELVDARTLLVSLSLKLKLKTVVELAQILLKDPTSISRLEIRERNCPNLQPIADNILSHLNQQKNLRIINQ